MNKRPEVHDPYPAEVVQDTLGPNVWRVEKLNADGDGGIAVTIFAGVDAQERADEYARWKYQPKASIIARSLSDAYEAVNRFGLPLRIKRFGLPLRIKPSSSKYDGFIALNVAEFEAIVKFWLMAPPSAGNISAVLIEQMVVE